MRTTYLVFVRVSAPGWLRSVQQHSPWMREIPALCRGAGPDSGEIPYTGSTSGKPADVGDDQGNTRDEVLHLPPAGCPREKSIQLKQDILLLGITDQKVLRELVSRISRSHDAQVVIIQSPANWAIEVSRVIAISDA